MNDGASFSLNYDLNFAPPTYGDLFFFLMLGRYFFKKGINTKFFISNASEHKKLVNDFMPFIARILPSNGVVILPGKLKEVQHDLVEVFGECRGLNIVAHHHNFNLLNYLISAETESFCQDFLLKPGHLGNFVLDNQLHDGYFAVHCRYIAPHSDLYSLEKKRNTNEKQFVRIVKEISKIFPTKKIIILSDSLGTKFYKSISSKYNLNCFFSETENKTFFHEAKIILGADWYFQLNGGGLSAIAWFSNVKYVTFVKAVAHEVQWSSNSLTSWATKQQIFRQINMNEEFFSFLKVRKEIFKKSVSEQ